VIDYFKRLWAFRCAGVRAPGASGRFHRWLKLASVLVWTVLFGLAHGAGAQEAVPTATIPTATVPSATVGFAIPDLPTAVRSAAVALAADPSVAAAPAAPGAPVAPAVPSAAASGAAAGGAAVSDGSGTGSAVPTGTGGAATIGIDLGGQGDKPSTSVMIIVALTVLSLAPSLLIMMTSFTRMVIVLGLTRNAIGLQSIPPNQVVVGLALFLSLFVMSPVLGKMNDEGLQPLLRGEISQSEAVSRGSAPLKQFMLANTRRAELQMMITASKESKPATPDKVPMTTLIPAFVLSELKTAFIIGFVIFIPFLVIDLVVSAVLMALGMMMLPPAFVALPFKLLLFVMVDGWSLIAKSLVDSFR
jgi:flagellar biosynthesis protein FliP